MKKPHVFMVIFVTLASLICGCATQKVSRCTSPQDNAQIHYVSGMEALERDGFDVAQQKFERALYCDEGFSPAYGGLAIVYAYRTSAQKDPDYSSVEKKKVIESENKAAKTAGTSEEEFAHYLSMMRVTTYMDGKNWVSKTEDARKSAMSLSVDEKNLLYYQGKESADYFMGLAYLRAHEFQKARKLFADVLNARKEGKWNGFADAAWKKTDRVERAIAGLTVGDIGKRIAVKDAITRGDLAALLTDEVKIDKLFGGRAVQEFTPSDIAAYPFKEEVVTVLRLKVRGLEPKYDGTSKSYLFKPLDTVKRGEMAFVLEDILIKITGDEKIATAFLGHDKSPFPDVKPTSQFYNAIMNMTTRGIMEGQLSGEFRVDSPVDGAEAVLAIRVLKQKLNIK
jgi:hypothetical protein